MNDNYPFKLNYLDTDRKWKLFGILLVSRGNVTLETFSVISQFDIRNIGKVRNGWHFKLSLYIL